MRNLLNLLPSWLIIVFIISIFLTLVLFTSYLHMRFVKAHNHISPSTSSKPFFSDIGNSISTLSTIYSILIGLVVIALWTNFQHCQNVVEEESSYLIKMIGDAQALSPNIKRKIWDATNQYMMAVRTDEWEKMRIGQSSKIAYLALINLYKTVQSYAPQTPLETIYYQNLVTQLNGVLTARRKRLLLLDSVMPTTLQASLFTGGLLIIIFTSLFGRITRVQISANIALAFLVALNLSLTVILDYPFSGDVSAKNTPFQIMLENFDREVEEDFSIP